jgi:tetratricopeptide (TPR) repeat protein
VRIQETDGAGAVTPSESDASHAARAAICLQMGQWTEAIAHSRAWVHDQPQSLAAREIMSHAYLQLGRLDRALSITDELIRLAPTDPTHHFQRGILQQQQQHFGEALRSFMRVGELAAHSPLDDEARAAIWTQDMQQIRRCLALAVEDMLFRLQLRQNPRKASQQRGFALSDAGAAALAQIDIDDLPRAPAGWRHYGVH